MTDEQKQQKRIDRMLLHLRNIVEGRSNCNAVTIAAIALKDDEMFQECLKGRHSWIEVTAYGDTEMHFVAACCDATKAEQFRPLVNAIDGTM